MNPESQAILERLAGAKKPCGDCFGTRQALDYAAVTDLVADLKSATDTRGVPISCPTCAGTGEVLRFPKLSEECPIRDSLGMNHLPNCHVCQGVGRVPITENVLEAVLACLAQEGNLYNAFQRYPSFEGMNPGVKSRVFCFTTPSFSFSTYCPLMEGKDHLEAALRALEKVAGGR